MNGTADWAVTVTVTATLSPSITRSVDTWWTTT